MQIVLHKIVEIVLLKLYAINKSVNNVCTYVTIFQNFHNEIISQCKI